MSVFILTPEDDGSPRAFDVAAHAVLLSNRQCVHTGEKGTPLMTDAEKLTDFVTRTIYDDVSDTPRIQLIILVLDVLG